MKACMQYFILSRYIFDHEKRLISSVTANNNLYIKFQQLFGDAHTNLYRNRINIPIRRKASYPLGNFLGKNR